VLGWSFDSVSHHPRMQYNVTAVGLRYHTRHRLIDVSRFRCPAVEDHTSLAVALFAKSVFNICLAQPLQNMENILDGPVSGRSFPIYLESLVQLMPMDFDESADAAIRMGAGHDRKNRKQQDVLQFRACLQRAVGPGLSRGEKGTVQRTSRQPPCDSVASYRFIFRVSRPRERFIPRGVSDRQPG
jgi:hypothetical protein